MNCFYGKEYLSYLLSQMVNILTFHSVYILRCEPDNIKFAIHMNEYRHL